MGWWGIEWACRPTAHILAPSITNWELCPPCLTQPLCFAVCPHPLTPLTPRISYQFDRATNDVIKRHPHVLPRQSGGKVVISLTSGNKVPMELFSNNKTLGRFMLRQGGETVAAGVVVKIMAPKKTAAAMAAK